MVQITTAYIGIGANLGEPIQAVRLAAKQIAALEGVHSHRLSPLYRTTPVNASPPDFINAVCEIKTALDAYQLFEGLEKIELTLGKRPKRKEEARPIDLDLLLFGDLVLDEERLQLPHPRFWDRLFVLLPLSDLIEMEGLSERIAELSASQGRIEKLADGL